MEYLLSKGVSMTRTFMLCTTCRQAIMPRLVSACLHRRAVTCDNLELPGAGFRVELDHRHAHLCQRIVHVLQDCAGSECGISSKVWGAKGASKSLFTKLSWQWAKTGLDVGVHWRPAGSCVQTCVPQLR